MRELELSEAEIEYLSYFALGLALGLALASMALRLVEEWVIASDLADRRRIREVVHEILDLDDAEDEASERAREVATVSALRPECKQLTVEAAK